MDFEALALSLLVSLMLCFFFWPKKKQSELIDIYLETLSHEWMEEEEIYVAVLNRRQGVTLNQHNTVLSSLLHMKIVEQQTVLLREIQTIESENDIGRTHIDRIIPFVTITSVEYRLQSESGGNRLKKMGLSFA